MLDATATHRRSGPRPDALAARRRALQVALGGLWLVDALMQSRPVMFTDHFAVHVLAPAASGNPPAVAGPIIRVAGAVARQPVPADVCIVAIQLLLAAGLFWQRSVKVALTVSIVWSLAAWWLAEGLGGVLSGMASPLMGAPGPALLYALAAVLVWPSTRDGSGAAIGSTPARVLWLLLWTSLAWFALAPANRAPGSQSGMVTAMAEGEPDWLATLDRAAGAALTGHDLTVSVMLAVLFVVIGTAVLPPIRPARILLGSALVVATVIWMIGQNFGGVFTGTSTDPGSGPPLVLLTLAYWPARTTRSWSP